MESRIWRIYTRLSLTIDRNQVLLDVWAYIFVETIGRNKIYWSLQDFTESSFDVQEVKKTISFVEIDKQINITFCSLFASSVRAKEAEVGDAALFSNSGNLILMLR